MECSDCIHHREPYIDDSSGMIKIINCVKFNDLIAFYNMNDCKEYRDKNLLDLKRKIKNINENN